MQQPLDATRIYPHMPVVSSDGGQVGTVDHLDVNSTIKLTRDEKGQHHWIPQSWVASVDDKVHVDRPSTQAMKQWSAKEPMIA